MPKYDCTYDCAYLTVYDALTKVGLPEEIILKIVKMTTKKEKINCRPLDFWFSNNPNLALPAFFNHQLPIVQIEFALPPIMQIEQVLGRVHRNHAHELLYNDDLDIQITLDE